MSMIVIDGGRTKIRSGLVIGADRVAEATSPGLPILVASDGPNRAGNALRTAMRAVDATDDVECVVVGANGIHIPNAAIENEVASIVWSVTPHARVIITSDVVTSYLGALGTTPGFVLAAGTGVVGLVMGHDFIGRRLDGWGPINGDRGGGFDIGRRGLAAAYRSADGAPGGSSDLLARWQARFPSADAAWGALYSDPDSTRVIASFTPDVLAAAESGDRVARDIRAQAVEDLLDLVAAAALLDGDVVSAVGGLLGQSSPLLPYFLERFEERFPTVLLRDPAGDALDGAQLLGSAPDYFLSNLIGRRTPTRAA